LNSRFKTWGITKINCSNWNEPDCTAAVWASNWSNDELEFEMAIHPDVGLIFYNIGINFVSIELSATDAYDLVEKQLSLEANNLLEEWWPEVIKAKRFMGLKDWEVPRGYAVNDLQYARLAQLYALRARYAPLNVTQLLSEDMSVPLTTTKERIRKAREKGFLTSPGKGLNGQGEVTKKAKQLLEKEEK
jgi:hypothetical protein